MIVVRTTIARYPRRGHVFGYLCSCRFPRALTRPRLGAGPLTAVVVIVVLLSRNCPTRHPAAAMKVQLRPSHLPILSGGRPTRSATAGAGSPLCLRAEREGSG